MEKQLRQWLENASQTPPADFYELLGCQRFHANSGDLNKAIRVANRFLHRFQNHEDGEVVRRARKLQMMVAEAEDVFSDQQRWSAYDELLIQGLRNQWDRRTTGSWHRADLRRWLISVQQVDSQRVDSLIEVFLKTDGSESPAPQLQQPSSGTPGNFWERAFPGQGNPAAQRPNPTRHSSPQHSSSNKAQPSASGARQSQPAGQTAQRRKKVGPPPRKQSSGPPPRQAHEVETATTTNRTAPTGHPSDSSTMAAFHAQRSRPSGGIGFLWIFGSAIATIFVLGLVALIVFLVVTFGR